MSKGSCASCTATKHHVYRRKVFSTGRQTNAYGAAATPFRPKKVGGIRFFVHSPKTKQPAPLVRQPSQKRLNRFNTMKKKNASKLTPTPLPNVLTPLRCRHQSRHPVHHACILRRNNDRRATGLRQQKTTTNTSHQGGVRWSRGR